MSCGLGDLRLCRQTAAESVLLTRAAPGLGAYFRGLYSELAGLTGHFSVQAVAVLAATPQAARGAGTVPELAASPFPSGVLTRLSFSIVRSHCPPC